MSTLCILEKAKVRWSPATIREGGKEGWKGGREGDWEERAGQV